MKNLLFELVVTLTLVGSGPAPIADVGRAAPRIWGAIGAGWANYLIGDLNRDGNVDLRDVWLLANRWLDSNCLAPACPADLDGIAGVSMPDFAELSQDWREFNPGPPETLVINEFMANNTSTIADPDEPSQHPDWIEIHNYGSDPVDIGGMYITDNLDNQSNWYRIPVGFAQLTTIGPGGYLLIWADNDPQQGPVHTNFALAAAGGEDVALLTANKQIVDAIESFPAQAADISYGRFPDGANNWEVLENPTPGKPNQREPLKIIINEIMYHPYHPVSEAEDIRQEYIELFNNGTKSVDLSGWRIATGVDFVFPKNVTIDAGQYLVVAADVDVFKAKYPDVTNVVGDWPLQVRFGQKRTCWGWQGRLSNRGEQIELVDAGGVLVDRVHYADDGDWAVRQLGPVDNGHRGWVWSDEHDGNGKSLELINPALPNEYGQNWAASDTNDGTPGRVNSIAASDIAPLIVDVGHFPIIPRPTDQVTVTAHIIDEQTSPSRFVSDRNEPGGASGLKVSLRYHVDRSTYQGTNIYPHYNASDYNDVTMFDDGAHGDGQAGDAVYAGQIPALPHNTIVEFLIQATDKNDKARAWPAPSLMDGVPQQVTNLLYQVDQTFDPAAQWVASNQPIYYIIMTEMERGRLAYIGSHSTLSGPDSQMNGTFISIDGIGTELRYNVGIRNRGHGTRNGPPNNYHVNFPHDRLWKGVGAINFNCRYTHAQIIGSAIFRMAGLVAAETIPVQLRINGANLASSGSPMYGVYARLEAFNNDFADKHFPDDPAGNLYTCFRDAGEAQLLYQGTNPDTYRNSYIKANNEAQDDFSDLIHMLDVLNNAPDATYLEEVSKVINVPYWLRYIALDSLLLNYETGLNRGIGDDYFMYRGVADPRFVLIPHDLDTILGEGNSRGNIDQSIFSIVTGVGGANGVDGLRRFFNHPDVIALYYQAFLDLIDKFFNPEILDPLFDQVLGEFTPQDRTNAMKQFVRQRTAAVLKQIPQKLTIDSDLASNSGYYFTQIPVAAKDNVKGEASAINTRSVLINGRPAEWSQMGGRWSLGNRLLPLAPGINRVIVQTFDGPYGTGPSRFVSERNEPAGAGKELELGHIDIWYDDGSVSQISGTLMGDTVLDALGGPWQVVGDLIVPVDVSLTIMPGTTIFFDPNARVIIHGQLIAEGTQYSLIRFTRTPAPAGSAEGENLEGPATPDTWNGLQFAGTMSDNRICYAVLEYGQTPNGMIGLTNSKILLDHSTLDHTNLWRIRAVNSSLIVRNCTFTDTCAPSQIPRDNSTEHIWGQDIAAGGQFVIQGNVFGLTAGHNDAIDFSGASRPNPIPQILDNIFMGGGDDALDLETDAHIEGNFFANYIKDQYNKASGESNAISAGGSRNYTVVRNVFYNLQHIAQVKDDAFLTFVNNTAVGVSGAAIYFDLDLPGRAPGRGAYVDGSIFWDTPVIFSGITNTTEIVVHRSIIPSQWHHFGQGNVDADPLFIDRQQDFHLKPISPAIGAGPCELDMGAYVPSGAAICGEPDEVTYHTEARLTVGGPGITHYKYCLNDPNGSWSQQQTVNVPIELTGLANGHAYTVYVLGKNSAGVWQNSHVASHTWIVDTSYRRLIINEVLAHTHGADPDLIELYYEGPGPINLAGMSLTDDPFNPRNFVFSNQTISSTILNPGEYLVLYGDLDTQLKNHIGFALSAEGEGLYLYDKPSNGGDLVDSVVFGPQINGFSIGRIPHQLPPKFGGPLAPHRQLVRDSVESWKLNQPTFGQANVAAPLGDPDKVRINEWLANGQVLFEDDFIELYNPQAAPVELSGLYLTDNPIAQPDKHKIGPLSFVAGNGFAVFLADGSDGPSHVDFKLSADGGMIALLAPAFRRGYPGQWPGLISPPLSEIDKVIYGPQTTDVSQGRAPDGANSFDFLLLPTPGVANPTLTKTNITLLAESATKRVLTPASDIGDAWRTAGDFNDLGWAICSGSPGGVGYERSSGYDSYISLDVEAQMYNRNASCYIRIPFIVDSEPSQFSRVVLSVRYDDGFVAYLNGAEVARRNFTGTPRWNSAASQTHDDSAAVLFEDVDISEHIGDPFDKLRAGLQQGANILAIHGLNTPATSSDFLISAELTGTIISSPRTNCPPNSVVRSPHIGNWCGVALLDGLRVTELMYHAVQGSDYDFIELQNISDVTLDLTGVRFTEGIEFVFPQMQLAPGQYVVLASNIAAFASEYGADVNVTGPYTGNLSNSGEAIVLALASPLEAAIMRFEYRDGWYPLTDGGGKSLVICDPSVHPAMWNLAESWKQSDPTPGR